jgi:hypothetical protein
VRTEDELIIRWFVWVSSQVGDLPNAKLGLYEWRGKVSALKARRPNKGMKLTKLSAAWLPAWTCRLMPALVNGMDAGTASQLIPGVRPTKAR